MDTQVEQHTTFQTVLLHLLPGVLITIVFVLLGPWLRQNHLPPLLGILIPILIILIPVELGWIVFMGFRRNKKLSLEGIVLNRQPMHKKDYLHLIPFMLIWSIIIFTLLQNFDQAIMSNFLYWLPDWFQFSQFNSGDYTSSILTTTFLLFLLLNGFAGPIVEELYFRGYLLPRIEYLKGVAPLVNVLLFSLYHFFSPWQFFTRILAFYPLAFVVRWKKNIYPSIVTHCLLNIGFCVLTLRSFM
ncbi:MAG: CPBP family intramembrane metalloprotease [Anaerolineales bacterium]|jgi:membrane protease YdiL (CAAX protease family)|nr:CPBP family intramembrane metalloprotease [Anaerolineales bacterium]